MNNSEKGASSNVMYIVVAIVLILGGLIVFSRMNSTEAPTQDQKIAVDSDDKDDATMTDDKDTSPSGAMIAEDKESDDEEGDDDSDEVKTFEIEAGPFYFKAAEIRVDKGDKVKIVLKNVKGTHDWVVDEFDARTKITNAGETDTVEFTADKVGTFEYYCSVGNHRAQGMVGKLIVE